MSEIKIQIKNIKEIKSAFNKAPAFMAKNLSEAIKKTVIQIGGDAVRNAPARTSNLRGSEYTKWSALAGEIGFRAKYACVYGADTQVVTDNGSKRIADIKKGDSVLTQDGNFHKVLATPRISAKEKPNLVNLSINWRKNMQHKLTLTTDHKVLSKVNGAVCWVEAGKLEVGDIVFQRTKAAHNKGVGKKYIKKTCLECTNKYIGQGKKYCSPGCRDSVYRKSHPQIGTKRREEARGNIAKANKKRFIEHPETHPNRIMSKNKTMTLPERKVKMFLDVQKVKYETQKQIGKSFVDFFCKEIKTIYEADGAYWHKNQEKDIKRDKSILNNLSASWKIIHIHFTDKRWSRNIINKPLPNVEYIQVNPSMGSYISLGIFEETTVLSAKKWTYKPRFLKRNRTLYDLTVEGVHSFVASGVVVSNSFVHDGTGLYGPRKTLIRPKNGKKVLATKENPGWGKPTKGGYYIIGKWSKGQKANPFLKKSVDANAPNTEKFLLEAVNNTLKQIGEAVG